MSFSDMELSFKNNVAKIAFLQNDKFKMSLLLMSVIEMSFYKMKIK
jgi:hypothetical protein